MYMTDIGNDFYMLRFTDPTDYDIALFGRPWLINSHYLTVQRRRLVFKWVVDNIKWIPIWIHILDLLLHCFTKLIVAKVGNIIRKTLRIDETAIITARDRFTRISVKLDLEKPLIPKVSFGVFVFKIEYGELHCCCYHCGKFGHKDEMCPNKVNINQIAQVEIIEPNVMQKATHSMPNVRLELLKEFGDWILLQRQPKKKSTNAPSTNNGTVEAQSSIQLVAKLDATSSSSSKFAMYLTATTGDTNDRQQ